MSKELVIAANRHEIKVAILEDDQLVEVFFQRANEYSLAGSIHKGRVTRVLPGMQSAFVDLGLDRDTFLYVSDFSDETEDFDRVSVDREPGRGESSRGESSRGESSRGESRRPPVERSIAPPPAPEPPQLREVESGAIGNEAAPSGAPPIERTDRGGERPDRGGDRGRRSRRRRGRGRGFPDSKYASADASRPPRMGETAPAAEPAAASSHSAPAVEDRPIVASAGATDFSVLPGESLAKYTRSNIQPLDEAEEDEIRDLQETSVSAESEAEIFAEDILVDESVDEIEVAPAEDDAPEPQAEPVEADAAEGLESSTPSDATPALSAQVREQGGRFPHRMPRRQRRKMRGSGQGEARFS